MQQQNKHRDAVRAAREAYDKARAELFSAIRAALEHGVGISAIARDADFSREYIAKIRDGKGPRDAQLGVAAGDQQQ
ncbi:hypothetical protein [Nocardia goodfellowii]|uniref:DNA-binding phage protein n=1 Tax=Nocardia goodfellowii TaxID=882446 RepID=A0ABS4QSN8_9NOCA|nr:hypothetical protein [Nocardia goodfellowii]MBP2194563.1 DNA-binding phage protein [Nocardia goodfellowii]